jgi:hypothetical protein
MNSNSQSPAISAHKTHLAIHSTNAYQHLNYVVTTMAASPKKLFLVARRACISQEFQDTPLSKLDIYDINVKGHTKFAFSIIEYEDITGLAWFDEKHFISVSIQAAINVYSVKLGLKTKVYTTDYGPIMSMKYSLVDNLLVTGTEWGYAVGYKISDSGNLIECDKKMTKVNGPIRSIDFHVRPCEVPMEIDQPKLEKKQKPKAPSLGKRKRSESSEESGCEETDQEDDSAQFNFLADKNITIYGACNNRVVVWDYHKMRNLDSVVLDFDACCVLALENGNFMVGDAEGYLGLYDNESFTCRQNERISNSPILCLARDSKHSVILAAGHEPIITLLKCDLTSEAKDEYILFERIKDHSAQVNCALFTSKKEFFTCSDDDLIIKFRISKSGGMRKLKRFASKTNYQSQIHCGVNEIMYICGKSLHIYTIDTNPQSKPELESYPLRLSLPEPKRNCVIKAYAYVHAAAFDDKWICYSTNRGITIIDRPGLCEVSKPSEDLPSAHFLKLCQSGRYLVAGQQKKLTITKLSYEYTEQELEEQRIRNTSGKEKRLYADNKSNVYETLFVRKLGGMVRDVLYQQQDERLIVSCGIMSHSLYILQLPQGSNENGNALADKFDIIHRLRTPCSPLSYFSLNYHDLNDRNLYIYTTRNQLIKCDTKDKSLRTKLTKLIQEHGKISNLPREKNVQGIVVLSKKHCLIYDSNYISKVDTDSNEIVNETARYDDINIVSNTIFKQPEEILIV